MVVPTYVGVIPCIIQITYQQLSGPHVCGGDPKQDLAQVVERMWSPRMWG